MSNFIIVNDTINQIVDRELFLAYRVNIIGGDMTLTDAAFSEFRTKYNPPRPPRDGLVKNSGEVTQMSEADGLCIWKDGAAAALSSQPSVPRIDDTMTVGLKLWAVRDENVVHADESCPFGRGLETGVIKHTNLTGGGNAYCAGELIFVAESTIIVNGFSGRYGPRTADEMKDVALAFQKSGYHVWSSGFDEEAGRPYPFIGVDPEWII